VWCHGLRQIVVISGLTIALLSASCFAGTIIYVDDDAEPGGDGQSWGTAFAFLQDALDAARCPRARVIDEIHVAQGLYLPDHDEDHPEGNGDTWETFALIDGVALMGGYAGIGAEDPDERNIELYETILSGDLLGDDQPGFVNYEDNSFHVVTAADNDETAMLEGFTVTAGYAHFEPYGHYQGGGMLVDAASPVVRQCLFVWNLAEETYAAGGGVCNRNGGHPVVDQCTFLENKSESYLGGGGGMANLASDATVRDCSFKSNTAEYMGGGLLVKDCTDVVVQDCDFLQNETFDPDPDEDSMGGAGIKIWYSSSAEIRDCLFKNNQCLDSAGGAFSAIGCCPTVSGCIFEQNYGWYGGGAIKGVANLLDCYFGRNVGDVVHGGAIRSLGGVGSAIRCTLVDNSAWGGGAGLLKRTTFDFRDCRFLGNSGTGGDGGAFFAWDDSQVSFVNCVFSGNSTEDDGGAVYLKIDSAVTLTNCTLSANTCGGAGEAVYCGHSDLDLRNCVVCDQGGTEIHSGEGSTVSVTYSCVCAGYVGEGNIDADPLFVDPDGEDDIFGTEDDDLRLGTGSPCIDAADNTAVPYDVTTDLDGNDRFVDDPDTVDTGFGDPPIVDMGAYEYQVETCPADFDDDGDVDTADLLFLLGAWGTPDGDVDGDGDTDTADLLALLAAWGPCR
jgi:hypothetical protein